MKKEKVIEKITVEQIAEIAYTATTVLSMMNNFGMSNFADRLGIQDRELKNQIAGRVAEIVDNHQPLTEWSDLTDSAKQSAIMHAQFYLDNPNAHPQAAHEDWLKRREADGWKYGEKTSVTDKTDAGMIPYSHRSAFHNGKDYLFKRTVEILSR